MGFLESERARPTEPGVILYPAFDESVRRYFQRHQIAWWGGGDGPTESPISSQVACVNHLEPARLDAEIALAVARAALGDADGVVEVEDGGFVAYEWIGSKNYLGERGGRRGAHRTSLDALIVAEVADERVLILIEWKYTESYPRGESRAASAKGTDRVAIYAEFLEREDYPIDVPGGDLRALFYDPLEQLMRQTLLGWQMAEASEFGATGWRHVHVIPAANRVLRETNPSPDLPGDTLSEAWRSVLREPDRYSMTTPSELLANMDASGRWKAWRDWLGRRYRT